MKNREIKFRAWYKEYNEMSALFNPFEWINEGAREAMTNADFMQFTGLLDKNGKEIYEGDVVKWANGKDAVAEVIYSGDRFLLHNLGAPSLAKISIDCEIIGNIYENPELTNWK